MFISSTVSNGTALIWKHCRRYICGFLCIMWCGACDNLKSCETGSVIGRYHQYESQQTLSFFVSQRTDLPFFLTVFLVHIENLLCIAFFTRHGKEMGGGGEGEQVNVTLNRLLFTHFGTSTNLFGCSTIPVTQYMV